MSDVATRLRELMSRRILIKDGAMGTMFQAEGLAEDDFRGARFANHPQPLKGDSDLLGVMTLELLRLFVDPLHRELHPLKQRL